MIPTPILTARDTRHITSGFATPFYSRSTGADTQETLMRKKKALPNGQGSITDITRSLLDLQAGELDDLLPFLGLGLDLLAERLGRLRPRLAAELDQGLGHVRLLYQRVDLAVELGSAEAEYLRAPFSASPLKSTTLKSRKNRARD